MGLGDDIMFLGEAEYIHQQTGKKITPLYGTGLNSMYDNVEFITPYGGLTVNARDTNNKSDVHIDYYVKEKKNTILGTKLVLQSYKPKPFTIRLTRQEQTRADLQLAKRDITNYVVVNPDYKSSFFSQNKNWGFKKWQRLTDKLSEHIQVVRIHPGKSEYNQPLLSNAVNITCNNIRDTISLIRKAKMGITYDGLLHHVFAGFKIPGVIIHGGLIGEENMSYNNMLYITYDHPESPCGAAYDCPHCFEANKAITVDMVYEKCLKLL